MTAAASRLEPAGRKEALVRRILAAALALFAENGFHGTTMPAVMERAKVGGGSLYRLFSSKEVLVNAVYRDAKERLARAFGEGLRLDMQPRELFDAFWAALTRFAREEPLTFRFLEMQDHMQYLDGESRQREFAVLAPLALACVDFQRRGGFRTDVAPDTIMAVIWGAFVGLMKADRLGYARADDVAVSAAREACWRAFAAR